MIWDLVKIVFINLRVENSHQKRKKKFEKFLDMLDKNGAASLTNPDNVKEYDKPLSERLKDGSTVIMDFHDVSGQTLFSEFYERVLNGEFDKNDSMLVM